MQARLEIEKVERLEREAQTMKKIIDQNFGTGQVNLSRPPDCGCTHDVTTRLWADD